MLRDYGGGNHLPKNAFIVSSRYDSQLLIAALEEVVAHTKLQGFIDLEISLGEGGLGVRAQPYLLCWISELASTEWMTQAGHKRLELIVHVKQLYGNERREEG